MGDRRPSADRRRPLIKKMFEPPILTVKEIKLSFGPKELFSNIELYVNRGDKIALVGRNGSGKSTLLKILHGDITPDSGEMFVQPGIKIAYMPQTPDFSGYKSLKDVVLSGLPNNGKGQEYKADILIEDLGIAAEQAPDESSGGERRKAALAKTLVDEPDILLLDEPTNHLDMPTIEKLEEIIKNFSGAVIVISHDKMFLKNISQTTFWLDRGVMHRNNKGYGSFEEWQEQLIEQEIIEQKHLNKKIEAETEWLHKGVTARRKRNMGRLRRLQKLREERRAQVKQTGRINLEIEESEGRSKLVIEAKHINKSYGGRELIKDFSIKVLKGNKIGIVGPNGAGKTTLVKLLTKRIEPDSGFVRIGKNLEEAYFDQNLADLDNKKTLWKTLCNEGDHIYVRGQYRHVVAYLKDFLFKPEQAQCPVGALSGGERSRLMLALALAKPSNFLVLDEPTNDLDMDTIDLLQEVLDEYEGTALIVSHDRDFLDRVVTSVIYMDGSGKVEEFVGSYSELEEKLKNKPQAKKEPEKEKKEKNKTADSRPPKTEKKQKLSYSQQRKLDLLPQEIEALEKQIQEIDEALSDSSLYNTDREKFTNLSAERAKRQIELETKENEWLELQLLQEEFSSAQ